MTRNLEPSHQALSIDNFIFSQPPSAPLPGGHWLLQGLFEVTLPLRPQHCLSRPSESPGKYPMFSSCNNSKHLRVTYSGSVFRLDGNCLSFLVTAVSLTLRTV